MASSLAMNGRSPSSLSEGSEESFVVLSRNVDEIAEMDEMPSVGSTLMSSSIVYPTMPQVPVTDAVSQATSVMSTSVTSELSAEEIQSKLESLLEENLQLKATLQQNNLAMKKQFSTLVMWQDDVMKVHQSHKEKFEETKKLISNLRAENADLKKSSSLPTTYINKPEDEILNLKSKISALEFELDTLRQGNIKFKNDQSKVIRELEIKLSESEKARDEEVTKLKLQVDSQNMQFVALEQQYLSVQQKLTEALQKIPTEEEIQTAKNNECQLKELVNEVMLKNKVLTEKTDLIDNLHQEISKLKLENEIMPILKTQVDLYQTDFNAERDARNELKTERDRLAEDLHHLQRRNQKLLEEVERLRSDDRFVHVAPTAPNSSQAASRDQSPPLAQSQFICPVCSSRFRSYKALEEHVDSCI